MLLILAIFGGVAWEAWRSQAKEGPDETGVTGWRVPSLFEAGGSMTGGPELAAAVPEARRASMPDAPLASGEYEVCGVGRVKATFPIFDEAVWAKLEPPAVPVRQKMREALQASGDEFERAAGLFLESYSVLHAQVAQAGSAPARYESMDRSAIDALSKMAVSSRSPKVYALALHACRTQREGAACSMLSSRQWARLDPGNAAAWMSVMETARFARDQAAEQEALHRIGTSTTFDFYSDSVIRVALEHLPASESTPVRFAVLWELGSVTSGALFPGFGAVTAYCDPNAVRDWNRRQACSDAAEVMVGKGRMLLDVMIGGRLGERLGWSPERVMSLKDEMQSSRDIIDGMNERGGMGCGEMARQLEHVARWGQDGEMAELRRQIRQRPEGEAARARKQWQANEVLRAAEVAARAASEANAK